MLNKSDQKSEWLISVHRIKTQQDSETKSSARQSVKTMKITWTIHTIKSENSINLGKVEQSYTKFVIQFINTTQLNWNE